MEKPQTESRSAGWTGAIGILLSILLLAWTLRDVHFAEIRGHLSSIHPGWFAATLFAATFRFVLVTERWRYLLRQDGAVLPFTPLWHATTIGFMANNLLPARTGEVARAYAASSMTGVRFTTAAASIAVERVMDGITLVAMLALAASAGGFSGEVDFAGISLSSIIKGMTILFSVVLVAAMFAAWQQDLTIRISDRIANALLPQRWAARITAVVKGLLDGLDALRSPGRLAAVAAWSVAGWGLNGLSFLFCMYAFDIQAPWTAAFVLQSVIGFGVALPQAPGYWGVFEAATKATLLAYGISSDASVSYAVAYHFGTFFPITLLGIYSLGKANLRFRDLRSGQAANPAPEPQ